MWESRPQIHSNFQWTDYSAYISRVYRQVCFVIHYIHIYIYIYIIYPYRYEWYGQSVSQVSKKDVKNSLLSRQSAQMTVRLSAVRTSRDLLTRNINFLFVELISVICLVHPMALYGMRDYENWTFVHYIGPRTSDLPAGIVEPYPLQYRSPQCVCVCVNGYKKVKFDQERHK
jgi:hypothetical protein